MTKLLLVLTALVLSCTQTQKISNDQQASFEGLYKQYWDHELESSPILATLQGVHDYDHLLKNPSVADFKKEQAYYRELLEKVEKLPYNKLDSFQSVNRDFFISMLKDNIKSIELELYYLVFDSRGSFHTMIAELPIFMPFKNKKGYENYLARLAQVPQYFESNTKIALEGLSKGFTLPKKPFKGYEDTFLSLISKDPTKSVFYKPFLELPKFLSATEKKELTKQAIRIIANDINPAYAKLHQIWKTKFQPKMRSTISVYNLPKGIEIYKFFIQHHTSLDLEPQKIHQIGLDEVRRIRKEMKKIIDKVNYKGNIKSFAKFLRGNPKFFPKTKKELLSKVEEKLKLMDKKLPQLFGKLPKTPYGIKEVPAYKAPKETTAYYWPPALDGSRIGYYYVNTYKLDQRPLYEIEALSFHEAVPGHHLQIALQQEMKNLPKFRHISRNSAFVEGWALYAESIAKDVGFYDDPYSDFGRLTYEMWRACRLVVDTGIHSLGWSRSLAISFMESNTALTKQNIAVEVDRYITWPGQALAYKMGELKIKELRNEAKQKLGQKFELKEFHDVVLGNGAIPLTALENQIHRWEKSKL